MKRVIVAVLVLSLAVACADRAVHVVRPADLPADLYPQGARTPRPSETSTVTVFMLDGNRLAPVTRTGRSDMPLPELVLRALLSGPSTDELAKGLSTALPAPVELTGVTMNTGVAEVDFNAAFESTMREELLRRVAQVVYTLSELDEVDAVRFYTNGQLYTIPDQNGEGHTDAVAQGRYSRFAPRNPLGEPVSSAPLRIDVRDEQGTEEASVP
jgi:hypothetical protein